tara:strand:- start:220 stop:846 length:627 start_codon:yes stop_codon:yes gene_type:complete
MPLFTDIPGRIGKRQSTDRLVNEAEFEAIARQNVPGYSQTGAVGTQRSEVARFASSIGMVIPENNVLTLVRIDPVNANLKISEGRLGISQGAGGSIISTAIFQLINNSFVQVPGSLSVSSGKDAGVKSLKYPRGFILKGTGEYFIGTHLMGGHPSLTGYSFMGGSLIDVVAVATDSMPSAVDIEDVERIAPMSLPIITYLTAKAGGLM